MATKTISILGADGVPRTIRAVTNLTVEEVLMHQVRGVCAEIKTAGRVTCEAPGLPVKMHLLRYASPQRRL